MNTINLKQAIVIGDSTNNTLSIIRSLGEAKLEQCLILKCEKDSCFVAKSKYLKKSRIFHITKMEECLPILDKLKDSFRGEQTIICSFDEAAVFIDSKESLLSPFFRTPTKGKHIGILFNKYKQCELAQECGITVPQSIIYHRSDSLEKITFDFPVILKPLNSTRGEKEDIHICRNLSEIKEALKLESHCQDFIVQKFIDKEYEIDCIGVRTEKEMYVAGGIRKYRHYPPLIGAGAYGLFQPMDAYDINLKALEKFMACSGYYGPFSVEYLHKDGRNYFMEVNFRNEGLAYAATAAGANLHALYINPEMRLSKQDIRKVWMMNYSLDFLYVKSREVSLLSWLRDLFRTRCFININFKDLAPIFYYYISKILHKSIR